MRWWYLFLNDKGARVHEQPSMMQLVVAERWRQSYSADLIVNLPGLFIRMIGNGYFQVFIREDRIHQKKL